MVNRPLTIGAILVASPNSITELMIAESVTSQAIADRMIEKSVIDRQLCTRSIRLEMIAGRRGRPQII